MHLVEVDALDAETRERLLTRPAQVLARAARQVGRVVHLLAPLRRDHHVASAQRSAEVLLALPLSVDVGGVEERHARVERRVDDLLRRRCVEPRAEVVAAEADDRDLGAVTAEAARPHAASSTGSGSA